MDVEEFQEQACKFSRVGNGSSRNIDHSNKMVVQKGSGGGCVAVEQYPDVVDDDDEDGVEIKRVGGIVASTTDESGIVAARLRGWHNSSRIFRVSRSSGGKDRHSKVLTSKGLRDRRVRLSVSTAIAFYDLQDRLGYDQPSKAVEWLIKAADEAIAELPSLNSPFPVTPPKQLSDVKRVSVGVEQGGFDSNDVDLDGEYPNYQQQQQQRQLSLSKSACSSTSETSKGSGLSVSRSDVRVNRVKARERARERAAKEKERENDLSIAHHLPNNSSFTELLNAGIGNVGNNNNNNNNTSSTSASAQQSPGGGGSDDGHNLFHKSARQWPPSTPMDCFSTGLLGSSRTTYQSNSGFLGHAQLGNSPLTQSMIYPAFAIAGDSHNHHHHHHHPPEMQHFSFMPDHITPVTASQPGGGNENYNLNFTISSSGLAGYNRGTLQSNSSVPSFLPHLQRFSPIDGSNNVPFFIGAPAAPSAAAAASHLENSNSNNNNNLHHYHQFAPGLQLYHGDETRHFDQKGKGKN